MLWENFKDETEALDGQMEIYDFIDPLEPEVSNDQILEKAGGSGEMITIGKLMRLLKISANEAQMIFEDLVNSGRITEKGKIR